MFYRRLTTICLTAGLLLTVAHPADAGFGLFKRLCKKKTCPPTTCCEPVATPVPICCPPLADCPPTVIASVETISCDPCTSLVTKPGCLQNPALPPGTPQVKCEVRLRQNLNCCSVQHAGDPDLKSKCMAAAIRRYRYCSGLPISGSTGPNKVITTCDCCDPAHYGLDPNDPDYYGKYYDCDMECAYGQGCYK